MIFSHGFFLSHFTIYHLQLLVAEPFSSYIFLSVFPLSINKLSNTILLSQNAILKYEIPEQIPYCLLWMLPHVLLFELKIQHAWYLKFPQNPHPLESYDYNAENNIFHEKWGKSLVMLFYHFLVHDHDYEAQNKFDWIKQHF